MRTARVNREALSLVREPTQDNGHHGRYLRTTQQLLSPPVPGFDRPVPTMWRLDTPDRLEPAVASAVV